MMSNIKKKLINEIKLKVGFLKPKHVYFLHIPKTGGTFVGQLEGGRRPVLHPIKYLGHAILIDNDFCSELDMPKGFLESAAVSSYSIRNGYVFSNVRNIYSFLVSYAQHAAGSNPRYHDSTHYDYKVAAKGFDYLVRTIVDREDVWPSRRLIHFPLFSQPSGSCVVDWVNNTATLYENLPVMAKMLGVSYEVMQRQRVSGGRDYKDWYSDSLIDLVAETWRREIDLFGFRFDDEKAFRNQNEIIHDIKNIKYIWRDDSLIYQRISTI